MTQSIRLTDDDRSFLRYLLTTLQLTQKGFSERAGVQQGWLSGVMSGKRPAVEMETFARIGQAALNLVEEAKQEQVVGEIDLTTLERGINKMFGVREDQEKLLAPPGGAIPSDAANFIERPEEMRISLELLSEKPFTMAVEGGPLSGKTTFLKWFEEEAEKRGFEVAYLDCGDFASTQETSPDKIDQKFNEILIRVAEYLAEAWLLPNVKTEGMRFMNWWLRMKGPLAAGRQRQRLLILDRVTRLGLEIGEYLLKLIRNIHNSRGADGVALSFALGVDADIVSIKNDLQRSPAYSIVHPRLAMRRFNHTQIEQMLVSICGSQFNPEWVERIMTLSEGFHCQPYFVHAAIKFLANNPSIADLEKEIKTFNGDFETVQHMERYIKAYRPSRQELADAYDKLLAA